MTQALTAAGKQQAKDNLLSYTTQFAVALGNKRKAEQFTRVALTAIQENPKLMECTEMSRFLSFMKAAQLDLFCDGLLGQAYLVPYKDKNQGLVAQLIIGYRGYRELALRTNKYVDLYSHVVHQHDDFFISLGTNQFIRHSPSEKNPGVKRGVYAVAIHHDKTPLFHFMWADQIEAHKKQYSKAWAEKKSLWQADEEMAWQKTVINKLSKRLQMSPMVGAIMAREDIMDQEGELPEEDLSDVLTADVVDLDVKPVSEEKDEPADDDKPSSVVDALDAKAGKVVDEIEKHVEEKGEAIDNEVMDLRVAIEDHITCERPSDVSYWEQLDIVCNTVLEPKTGQWSLNQLGILDLRKIWKHINEPKPAKKGK